ncbi:MAG TPA: hypothetical protein VEQ10_02595 [Vicinamibacteria bacterium]|nr:hypothetical protein [Vicinamibacteria bacterium]
MTGRPGAGTLLAFLLAGVVYLAAGLPLLTTRAYEADVFDADAKRVVHDLARHDGTHYRTKVHPLFVLCLNPLGLALKAALVRPRLAALALNAAAAGAAVVLFRALLLRLGIAAPRAWLWTGLFATSATQVFFGLLPESYSFSSAALLLVFVAFAAGAAFPARLVAATAAFAMTVTNLAAAPLLAALAPAETGDRLRFRAARGLGLATLVLLLAVPLSLLQKRLYPGADVFFLPASVSEEENYLFRPGGLADVARRGSELAASVVFANLAAPTLVVSERADEPPVTRFGSPRPAGWAHAGLWAAALALALAGLARQRAWRRPLVVALAGWVGFNAVLHFVYGETLFLYSAHWTFAVIAIAAVGVEAMAARRRLAVPLALSLLIGLQVWTNAAFVRDLYRIYR